MDEGILPLYLFRSSVADPLRTEGQSGDQTWVAFHPCSMARPDEDSLEDWSLVSSVTWFCQVKGALCRLKV